MQAAIVIRTTFLISIPGQTRSPRFILGSDNPTKGKSSTGAPRSPAAAPTGRASRDEPRRLFLVKGQNNNVETPRNDTYGVMAVAFWPEGRTVASK
jgi:hypothetical protein